jgi:NTP pyrophosphatase (non-canonical NTP hydrolase)
MSLNFPLPFAHLTPENAGRLQAILQVQILETVRLTRLIESETGYESRKGQKEMADVLAYVSVLADARLNASRQAAQLSKIEARLRRILVKHPEEVVRSRLGQVWDLWQEYERSCYRFREAGELRGAPRHEELEELRNRISLHMKRVRAHDARESSWDEAVEAAADATQAAQLAVELANRLDHCIGVATKLARDTRRFRANIAVAIIAIIVGATATVAVAGTVTNAETSGAPIVRTVTQAAPSPPNRPSNPHQGVARNSRPSVP